MDTKPVAPMAPQAPLIIRENVLSVLEAQLSGDTKAVVLDGPNGIGKTTILRQFVARHIDHSFALFISSASRWAYNPAQMLADLCEQIEERLPPSRRQFQTLSEERRFARLVHDVSLRARTTGALYYFVVDGLEEIPEEDSSTRSEIFDLLPFGVEGLRFLLTGDITQLPFRPSAKKEIRPYTVWPFTRDEAQHFLEGLNLTNEEFDEIARVTGCVPGELASVRRLAEGATPAAEILTNLHKGLFELEWRTVGPDETQKFLLAILAHENRPYTIERLSQISGVPAASIRSFLEKLKFLTWESQGSVRFVSESFRRSADSKLAALRIRVNDAFIEFLQRDAEGDEALSYLPNYFASADKLAELVAYLSPERFVTLYRRSPTLKLVEEKAEQGIAAARKLRQYGDVVRFTLQQSTIKEIASSEISSAEVKALAALNDYEAAAAIAEAAVRPEERFRLLVAIARARRESGQGDDPALLTRVQSLYEEVDPTVFRQKGPEVAADLFHTFPDLAIELVSKGFGEEGNENSLDSALVRLAIEAYRNQDNPHVRQRSRDIHDRIADPATKRLSAEAITILGRATGSEAISEATRLNATGDRLYVLQHWMLANARRDDALSVLDQGLKWALQSTGYTANAQVYRELGACLPYSDNRQAVAYYIDIIDGQRASLTRLGPSEEVLRLLLLLARAEWRFDQSAARKRYLAVYDETEKVADLAARASCLARLVESLARTDRERALEQSDSLHQLAEENLRDTFAELLLHAADHLDAAKGVIEALVSSRPELAHEFAGMLNTEQRRDDAYELIVRAALAVAPTEAVGKAYVDAVDAIADIDARERTTARWIRDTARRAKSDQDRRSLVGLGKRVRTTSNHVYRASGAAALLAGIADFADRDTTAAAIVEDLSDQLIAAWHALEGDAEKLEIGYDLVTQVARHHPGVARRIVQELDSLKESLSLYNSETSTAASLGLRLALRAYAALVQRNLVSPNDFARIETAIVRVGSIAEQAALWSLLAQLHHGYGNSDVCSRVVRDRLLPLLGAARTSNIAGLTRLLVATAPGVYCGAPGSVEALLKDLPASARDEAFDLIISYLLTRRPVEDPYDFYPRTGFDIDYADATAIIGLLSGMEDDEGIYYRIRQIVDSAASPQFSSNFKHGQKSEIARLLTELAAKKFPNPRFIQHEGYRVAADAYINQIRDGNQRMPLDALAARARKIPNVADRGYVLGVIAATVREPGIRRPLVEEAVRAFDEIALLDDRVMRYQGLSTLLAPIDGQASRKLLETALTLSWQGTGDSAEQRRRSLVDAAYRLDPEFASSLVSATDDEPVKAKLESRLVVHRLKDALAERRPRSGTPSPRTPYECSRAAWMQLGSLNAGRAAPISPDRTLEYMQYAANQAVNDAYPIFAWAIENVVRFRGGAADARRYLVPLFEACLRGAELAIHAALRPGVLGVGGRQASPDRAQPFARELLVRDGERRQALGFLRTWLDEAQPDKIWIVDPYFTPASLEVLLLVQQCVEACEVVVLASKKEHRRVGAPYDDTYRAEWARLSAQDPPNTTIILAGAQHSGKFPVHDRWWLTQSSGGLDFGTSVSGLGGRWSEIKTLAPAVAATKLGEVFSYFTQGRREFEGEPIKYSTITL
jgi:hypothetical protein